MARLGMRLWALSCHHSYRYLLGIILLLHVTAEYNLPLTLAAVSWLSSQIRSQQSNEIVLLVLACVSWQEGQCRQ